MTLNSNALTTLQAVLDELGLTPADYTAGKEDKILERYINAASDQIENYCGRSFYRESSKEEYVAGYGSVYLQVTKAPINSIASITYDGDTIDSTNYSSVGKDAQAGLIRGSDNFVWTSYVSQLITSHYIPGTEELLYLITYDGGYYTPEQIRAAGSGTVTLPSALEDACIMLVTTRWSMKGSAHNIKSEKLMSHSVTYNDGSSGMKAGLPIVVANTIDPYRRLAQAV